MTYFQTKKHASLYQKYMIREPKEVISLILSYLEKKKGKPFELAVDVGCGTGQSTRILASHFKKVVGMDISEAQIKEAENVETSPNVSYVVAAAEKIPLKDGSVDLTTSSVAAHWFEVDGFLREVDRVLKPNGCLALYCLIPHFDLHYKDCSKCLTDTFMESYKYLAEVLHVHYCIAGVIRITVHVPELLKDGSRNSKSFPWKTTRKASTDHGSVFSRHGGGGPQQLFLCVGLQVKVIPEKIGKHHCRRVVNKKKSNTNTHTFTIKSVFISCTD
ncbi:uncharacterized protein LOC144770655 isoform X1 [Lissotriton helveticus]